MSDHTFVILAHGDSPFLPACLESLQAQTVESEWLISTSTPSPYLEALADQYGIPLRITEPGMGIAHDWNFALRQAETRYVTLAHQDDVYLPRYAERCLEAIGRYPDAQICFPDYTELADGKERRNNRLLRTKRGILRCLIPGSDSLRSPFRKRLLIAFGSPIPAPAVLYDLKNIGDFSFSEAFSINMDWDAWYRMAGMPGRFVYVRERLMQHRIHSDSATTSGLETNRRQEEDQRMFARLWPLPLARVLASMYAAGYESNATR